MRNATEITDVEEIRWQIVKAMLHDFPQLKQRLKRHLKIEENREDPDSPQTEPP